MKGEKLSVLSKILHNLENLAITVTGQILFIIQSDSKSWTQFCTSIFPELHFVLSDLHKI